MTPPPLIGVYRPPPVRRGERVYCRYRAAWCRVTSVTGATVPWPRAQPEVEFPTVS